MSKWVEGGEREGSWERERGTGNEMREEGSEREQNG